MQATACYRSVSLANLAADILSQMGYRVKVAAFRIELLFEIRFRAYFCGSW